MSKIRFLHIRNFTFTEKTDVGNLSLKGGKTIAYRVNDDGLLEYVVAKCGKHENYNRRVGAMIAGGRLQSDRETCRAKYLRVVPLGENMGPIETLVDREGAGYVNQHAGA